MLLFASTLGALLSQVVGCIYGYLAYREAGLSRLARRWATSHREAVICYALGWDTLGKQWTSIMSCVLGNPFEMDNQWSIVIKKCGDKPTNTRIWTNKQIQHIFTVLTLLIYSRDIIYIYIYLHMYIHIYIYSFHVNLRIAPQTPQSHGLQTADPWQRRSSNGWRLGQLLSSGGRSSAGQKPLVIIGVNGK